MRTALLAVPSPLRLRTPLAALLAAAGGALAVLAFPPFGLAPALVVALAVLLGLLVGRGPREGLLIGWAFGIGLLGVGVFWIRISLDEFGNMGTWLAHALTLLFILAMALYHGLLGALTAWLCPPRPAPTEDPAAPRPATRDWAGPLLAFPALWVLLEWLRGWFLTGFPWLNAGDTQVDGPLAGFVPVLGGYGVSLLIALSAVLLWGLVAGRGRARRVAALTLLWLAGLGLGRLEWTQPAGAPIRAAVLQANIPQSLKWNEESLFPTLRAYVELTREAFGNDVIVWPETAIPEFLDRVRKPLLEPLAAEARQEGAQLVIGLPVLDHEHQTYHNSLISLGKGEEDLYHKRHLVPFVDFMPLRSLLGPLAKAFQVPMSDFSSGAAERPLLQVGPHRVGVSICYEDAFAAEVVQALPDAAYLINVSNDAWFGDSLAPHQHLGIARMRALENGRPLLRATNTGISAIIDHRGQVQGQVPAFERGLFSAEIQPRAGLTPFARLGNGLAIGLAWVMLGWALIRRLSARRRP